MIAARADTRRLERAISILLRVGVIASLLVIVTGTVVAFVQMPAYRTSARVRAEVTNGRTPFPHSISAVFSGVAAGHGTAIVALGLLVLLLTPIARVAVSVVTFAVERDRAYVVLTGFVLTVLLVSFLLGKTGGA